MDNTIARSALAVPSRVCAAVSIGGELPSIGLFTRVRGRGILRTSRIRFSEVVRLFRLWPSDEEH